MRQSCDERRNLEEQLRETERRHAKEVANLREDLAKKSARLSETNLALAKAADKIEELSELKQNYMQKAKVSQKRAQSAETELALKRDALDKVSKENRELRRHLKFKDKELLRVAKEHKIETQRLKNELHLQVENNKAIIQKMRTLQKQRKSGREGDTGWPEKATGERAEKGSEDSLLMSGDEEDIQLFAA